MADDLSAPLGQGRKRKRSKFPVPLPLVVAGVLGFCVAVFLVWAAVVDDPSGGEPMVVLSTEAPSAAKKPDDVASNADTAEPKAVVPVPDPKPAEPAKGPPAGMQTVTIIDGASGNRQEVLVPSQGGAGARAAAADPKLLEATRHGSIPRISLDGGRASTVYARPVNETPAKANLVRVALVISGLGIGSSNTAEALAKLLVRRWAPGWLIGRGDRGDQRLLEAGFAHSSVSTMSFWVAWNLSAVGLSLIRPARSSSHSPWASFAGSE